jgi:DNA adenine methylase
MKPTVTPLRYPGGKSRLLGYVEKFLMLNHISPDIVCEPYAGAASISVGLLQRGIVNSAHICEKDPLIVAYWNAIKFHFDDFVESIKAVEVSMDTWFAFKKYLSEDSDKRFSVTELALAFLFYNRTNYSGIIKGGPLGGKSQKSKYKLGCRFNKTKIIEKLVGLNKIAENVQIIRGDGLEFMKEESRNMSWENKFFYVDPPFYRVGKDLYREFFKDEDHINLADFLADLESPWLLSYDDSDFIRNLYREKKNARIYTDYQANFLKKSESELLFSNRVIPPGSTSVNFKYLPALNFDVSHILKKNIKIS